MNSHNVVILGSTGSIGRSTLDVIKQHPGSFRILALAAHSNAPLLAEQCRQHRPRYACLVDESRRQQLEKSLAGLPIELCYGERDLVALAELSEAETVVNAVVGSAGLHSSLAALAAGKRLALANKESMVAGGPLFPRLLEKSSGVILPIDSEHSAIWQALQAGKKEELRRIIITASGGPFRQLSSEGFKNITVEQALDHPTWKMGPKITVDSATLANKGLEVIEAVALFQVPAQKVSVVVHPQSMIHSMVEFIDSSIIAQLSCPDMRLPITCALFWPDRVASDYGRVDFTKVLSLTFEPPDMERFPVLGMAFEAATTGGTAPAIFSAANEVAVECFLNRNIEFNAIARVIEKTVDKIDVVSFPGLEDIVEADRSARVVASEAAGVLI